MGQCIYEKMTGLLKHDASHAIPKSTTLEFQRTKHQDYNFCLDSYRVLTIRLVHLKILYLTPPLVNITGTRSLQENF